MRFPKRVHEMDLAQVRSVADAEEAEAWLEQEMSRMDYRIGAARHRGEVDPLWLGRISGSKRHALTLLKRVRDRRQRLTQDAKLERQASVERRFMDRARSVLDPDTFAELSREPD